ncbi:MAG TPA: hypothetical protein VJI33_03575 [Candidatus Paceibacterota bacterium]
MTDVQKSGWSRLIVILVAIIIGLLPVMLSVSPKGFWFYIVQAADAFVCILIIINVACDD